MREFPYLLDRRRRRGTGKGRVREWERTMYKEEREHVRWERQQCRKNHRNLLGKTPRHLELVSGPSPG